MSLRATKLRRSGLDSVRTPAAPLPVRFSRSLVVPATGDAVGSSSAVYVGAVPAPAVPNVTGPAMVRVPGLMPGLTMPPGLIVTAPRMPPVPPSVPAALTVTAPVPVADDTVPLTGALARSVPAVIVVGPLYV